MADTNFINCDPDQSHLITVTSGGSFVVVDCWFSGSRERELNADFFLLDDCHFGQKTFPAIDFLEVEKEQWLRRESVSSESVPTMELAKPNVGLVVFASAGIAAVVAVGLTAVIAGVRKRICVDKVPRALQ
jgi:hypothetical protein